METNITLTLDKNEIEEAIKDFVKKKTGTEPEKIEFADDAAREIEDVKFCKISFSKENTEKIIKYELQA